MKKTLTAFLALCAALPLAAQSLADNSFYQKGIELAAQAKQAYENGDYDSSADLAAQAEQYFVQSDTYVARMIALNDAQNAVSGAEARLSWADSVGARSFYADKMKAADASLASAKEALTSEDFPAAKAGAQAVLDALADVRELAPLPASYVVKYDPKNRDCLWKIAALPFVYNDSWQWSKLYKANRKKLQDPANPNLIQPGVEIIIPSLRGEKREGRYDPAKNYAPLPPAAR